MKSIHIFDLDGTLVDSMGYWAENYISMLRENGIAYPDDIIKIITPMGMHDTAVYFISLGLNMSVPEIKKMIVKRAYEDYSTRIELKPYVAEYVRRLKEDGKKLYVLTASPHEIVDACLKHNGIYGEFEEVWSTEDFGMSKSNPEIYAVVADRIGCTKDDIAFYDDNCTAVETAKKAGIFTVGIYDKSSDIYTDIVKKNSDIYINSFKELL